MKPTESADPSPEVGGELPSMRAGRAGRPGFLGARTPETRPVPTGAGGQGRRGVLPFLVVGLAVTVLTIGIVSALSGRHALFPGGPVGWALALLTGIIVGHLVALGRDRWWGGTGSGAALTLGVLILYGWVPAGLVSLAVVSLVGAARRHRWRQGLLHGSVDILGIGAGALVLAAFGEVPSVETPWLPTSWGLEAVPEIVFVAVAYLLATRFLLWIALAPRGDGLPTVARTALLRQALVAVALLGIAPLICVVAISRPVLLPLFAVPLIALDSTLWIARARAEEQLRDPLTGLPNRQWLLERAWSALDEAERSGTRAALVLIDLDRFRAVNDTLGHLAGDRLLLQIAERLRQALPEDAEAARLGGDEFAVLLPFTDSTTSAQRIARHLVADLSSPSTWTASRSSWRPVRASPSSPTTRSTRRGCCDARTWRCTRPSATAPAWRCTSPSGTATPPTAWASSATSAGPSTPAKWNSTTSPRSASTARWPGSKPSCAGSTRNAAGCPRTSSSRSPRPPG